MNNHRTIILSLAPLLFLGCVEQPPESPPITAQPADRSPIPPAPAPATERDATFDKVVEESREAAAALREWSAESRDDYVAKAKAQLAEVDRRLEVLNQRAAELSEQSRAEVEREIAELKERRSSFRAKLDDVATASEDAWQEVAKGASDAWSDLRAGFQRAAEKFQRSPQRQAVSGSTAPADL